MLGWWKSKIVTQLNYKYKLYKFVYFICVIYIMFTKHLYPLPLAEYGELATMIKKIIVFLLIFDIAQEGPRAEI